MSEFSFYVTPSNLDGVAKQEFKLPRADDDGSGIWIDLVPDPVHAPGSIKIEVFEGRLQVLIFGEDSFEDESATIFVMAENYDEFVQKVKGYNDV